MKCTVDFRLLCVCSLSAHQFQAKPAHSSFTILGILFQSAKDCNILSYRVQVRSLSVLIASLRQLWGSQTFPATPRHSPAAQHRRFIVKRTNCFCASFSRYPLLLGLIVALVVSDYASLSLRCGRAFLWTSRLMKTKDRLFSCGRKDKPQPVVSPWHRLGFFNGSRDFFFSFKAVFPSLIQEGGNSTFSWRHCDQQTRIPSLFVPEWHLRAVSVALNIYFNELINP